MNQGKLEVIKQEMARVNIDILGISELKWTGMGIFNSDDHYIYYCWQESLRRNGVALILNKRVQNAVQFSHQSCPILYGPITAACQASLSITKTWTWLKHVSIEQVMPSNHLILCRPLLFLPSILPSIGVFPMSQFFESGGQSIGASTAASVAGYILTSYFCIPIPSNE